MEEIAKSFIDLGKKRLEAKASDEAYSKVAAILETLDSEEQTLHEKVNTLLKGEEFAKAGNRGYDDEESSPDKIYEPWANEDSPVLEKMGGTVMTVLEKISAGLDDFAARL
jgi:hypothetical protein